jgi:lycopene cyclase domain-containing protein
VSYAQLNLVFLVVVAVVTVVLTRRAGVGARWWQAVALGIVVLSVLTVIFDSLMIMADLFRYEDDLMVGIVLWLTPVEDLAWPIAAGLLLPALWTWLGRRDTREDTPGQQVEPGREDAR